MGVAGALGLLCALAFYQYVLVSVSEYYSPSWYSKSSTDAEAHGVLVKRLMISDTIITLPTGEIRIDDAWVEEQTQIERRLLIIGRTVRTGKLYLIVHAQLPYMADARGTLATVTVDNQRDTVRMSGRSGTREHAVFTRLEQVSIPDTLGLVWIDR